MLTYDIASLLRCNDIKLLAYRMDRLYDIRTMIYSDILDYVIKVLYDGPPCPLDEIVCIHPEMVRWLIKNSDLYFGTVSNYIVVHNLDIIKWLDYKGLDMYTPIKMNHIVAGGNMRVIKWYIDLGIQPTSAIVTVAKGDLQSVIWLHDNYPNTFCVEAMDFAAKYNKMDIVNWLCENRTEGCTHRAVGWCVINGNNEMANLLNIKYNLRVYTND